MALGKFFEDNNDAMDDNMYMKHRKTLAVVRVENTTPQNFKEDKIDKKNNQEPPTIKEKHKNRFRKKILSILTDCKQGERINIDDIKSLRDTIIAYCKKDKDFVVNTIKQCEIIVGFKLASVNIKPFHDWLEFTI